MAEAEGLYLQILKANSDHFDALHLLGVVRHQQHRHSEALELIDAALKIKSNVAECFCNFGVVLDKLKRHGEAIAAYDKALELKPDDAEVHYCRATTLKNINRYEEALVSYERALAVKPDHARAFSGMVYCINKVCNWSRKAHVASDVIAHVSQKKSIISPFTLLGYSGDLLLQLQCARNFVADKIPLLPLPLWSGSTWIHDRIRIAYVSADFHRHATAYLMAELFERHDRSRFEIIGVSFGVDDKSEIRNRLVAAFDQFHDVRAKSDEEVAKLLHDLEVDIAVDLKGHTQDSRPGILAHRPAPIQASYLGFPGTMGAEFIDYIIADKTVAPFEHQPFYTEKIVHLPDCYQVNDTKRKIAERTPTRREAELPETGFIFCCFNNNWKITPEVYSVWMRLLHAVEGSVLWLLRDNESAERNLRKEAQARGIDPARLVFASRLLLEDHLARHRLADLFLDTLPCNAHTTASDALWAGLPVLTREGAAFAGRVAASLLNAIGLPELVTQSIEDYEALALRLAKDPSLLEGYRNRLATNRLTHPLFDTDRFRRHIEAAYTTMWETWQRGEQPRSFAVETERTQPPARQELPNLPQMLKRAVALHQKGEMAEAEGLYLQILKANSDHFDALHLLGVVRHQQHRHSEALELIDAALKSNPNVSQVLSSYGTVLDALNRHDEAIAAYDKALELKPDDDELHYCRATTLNKLKRHEEALLSYDMAPGDR